MPARNKPLDLQVSRGMGARFVVQFPAGFNLSAARAVIRINASTGGTFWQADQSLSFIAIDDSTDQISFTIKSDSVDLFGTKYEDIATVGDHDFRIDLTGSGTEAEPDWRLQGNWGVDAREGEQGDCQPGTVNVRFDDLTIQLRFTGALQITDVGGGGLDAVVEDPSPVMGGDFKTAGFAIIVGPDTVVEFGRIDDLGPSMRVRGTDTAAGSVVLAHAVASGVEPSIVIDFTGLIQFQGPIPARFAQKVFFDSLGIELNNAPIILDNAGAVGELRAGTASDLSLTAFANKTITLFSDQQIRFDGQIRADTTGLLRQTGGDFEIASIAALLLTGGATHKWVTTEGIVGEVIKLVAPGVLAFGSAAAAGLNAVIDDASPALGGNLETNDKDILFTGIIPSAPRATLSSTATEFKIQTSLPLILNAGDDIKWPTSIGAPGQVMKTDGLDQLTLEDEAGGLADVSDDLTPDLGGDLATLSNIILVGGTRVAPVGRIRQSGVDFAIERAGAARLIIDGGTWPLDTGTGGEVLTAQGDGTFEFDAPVTGGITDLVQDLTPQYGGNMDTNDFALLVDDVGKISRDGLDFLVEIQGTAPLIFKGGTSASSRLRWPTDDGLNTMCLVTNGAGVLSFGFRVANLVDDETPSLGGDLDLNTFKATELTEGQLGFIGGVWTFGGLNTAGTTEITQATATTPAKITLSGSVNRITFDAGRVDYLGDTRFLSELALDFGGFVQAKIQATGVNAVALTGEAGTTVSVLSDTALKLKGGTQEFSWPNTDTGNDGDVVTTDGAGVLRIASPSSVLVKNPGVINVLDPPDGFGFTKMKNTLSGANALINDTAIAFYIANATVPLMFPRGDYPFSVSITAPQGKVAPPLIFAPSQAVQHLTSGQNFAATYFHWFGDRIGDANPVPFFEQHAEGGFGLEGICLIGQPGDPDIFDPRCACGIRISRKDPGSIVNSGKSDYPFLALQQFDVGIIGGNLEEDQFGADNMRFGTVNFKDCRMGLMLLGEQQIGWYFDNFRYGASGSDPNQITEVAVNILGGGQLNIHAGKILANDIVLLRISPVVGSIGDNNALYRFGTLGQDASAGSLVLLDDRSEENGVGGQHKVIFDNFRHIGLGSGGPNFARISGFGQLVMNGHFGAGQLHDGLFLEGKGEFERAKAVFSACDCNFTPETVAGTLDRVFTGSGFFSLAEVLGMSNVEVRLPFNSSTSGNGVGDNTPTGAARTAWNALAPVAKYSGSGPLGDTVDLTR